MQPIQVDVIAPLPESWGLCITCEAFLNQAKLEPTPQDRSLEAFPPEWREDFTRLSDAIIELSEKYGQLIVIRLFDPRSPQGMVKCIRHRVRKYPSFLINGCKKITGLDIKLVEESIEAAKDHTRSS